MKTKLQQKKLQNNLKKLVKYLLLPATIVWIVFDVIILVMANYYFQHVIFGPLLAFTPIQSIIATILLLFIGYLVYKSVKKRRN